ncbi:hypothetical protein [Clostridium cadaveris]|uniref:hypothetical protein n=1 Tax=Clostridium cadaveris TaxID=1529 RepID=UPI000C07E4BE|nr:hypothetical protein [Clostridium cadaveris]
MTEQTKNGMLNLYKLAQRYNTSQYQTDVIERALDECVRNPNRDNEPENIIKSSMGSAKKVLKNRGKSKIELYDDEQYDKYLNPIDEFYDVPLKDVENINFIYSEIRNEKYASIIAMLYMGVDAAVISRKLNISIKHANTLISRARAYARNTVGVGIAL